MSVGSSGVFGIAIAGLVGIGIAAQVAILGRSSGDLHPLAVSLALQLAGLTGASVWATVRSEWSAVRDAALHWWWLPLGVGGWAVVAALGASANRIGVATTLAVSIAAQLLAGIAIEVILGNRSVGVAPIAGVTFILVGVVLVAGA